MSDQGEYVVSIEKLCASDDKIGEAATIAEAENKKVSTISEAEITAIDVNEKLRGLEKLVEAETQPITPTKATAPGEGAVNESKGRPQPKIQKVPFILRDRQKFEKNYEPRVVSVGPIHHGKEHLLIAEGYKPKLAAAFIKASCKETRVLHKVIRAKIKELRACYDEDLIKGSDDDTLSWILFLDGCSILQFIYCSSNKRNGKLISDFNIKNDHFAFAQQDLFLLENQIPFEVLRLLMNSTTNCFKKEMENSIEEFIKSNLMAPQKYREKASLNVLDDHKGDPTHLLDLLQQAVAFSGKKNDNSQGPTIEHSFRNVQELKTAGIRLKPSTTCSLRDITFNSFCFTGWLHLPPLIVDDSTGPKFLNLIAYEGCPDNFKTQNEVTSYIVFLDSLIDHANDVKELRSRKILRNLLGCDEEVAALFNEIATDLVPNLEMYKDVKSNIQKHYDNRWTTWIAEAYHTHFSSPWTILAFIAALLALALTGIQTWFGILSPSDPCENCCCKKS